MNYTQTFEQFADGIKGTDLALYAGAGIILYILFKDKLSPVQNFIMDFINKKTNTLPTMPIVSVPSSVSDTKKEDVFFQLIASWKQTRDLAVRSNCAEAVKVVDQMFPFLSPEVCQNKSSESK